MVLSGPYCCYRLFAASVSEFADGLDVSMAEGLHIKHSDRYSHGRGGANNQPAAPPRAIAAQYFRQFPTDDVGNHHNYGTALRAEAKRVR